MSDDCIRRIKLSNWMVYLLKLENYALMNTNSKHVLSIKNIRKELCINEGLVYKYMRCFELYGFVYKESLLAPGSPKNYYMTQKGFDTCKKIKILKEEIKND